jgi:hypothetical protein
MDISYKTKKMVENGLVLDERGTWIPLIDKLRMERFFIERLSAGEVLFNSAGYQSVRKNRHPSERPLKLTTRRIQNRRKNLFCQLRSPQSLLVLLYSTIFS